MFNQYSEKKKKRIKEILVLINRIVLLVAAFVMATMSIIAFVTINKNIAVGDKTVVENSVSSLITELSQNFEFEGRNTRNMVFYLNGVQKENQSVIKVDHDFFISIDYLEKEYGIKHGDFGSDYIFPIYTVADTFYFRLNSTFYSDSNGKITECIGAPILYKNELYLPLEMVKKLENQQGMVVSYQEDNGKLFYYTTNNIKTLNNIFRIKTDGQKMIFSNVAETSNYEVNKELALDIVELKPCNASNVLFARTRDKVYLLSGKNNRLEIIEVFEEDAELSYTGDVVYWLTDDVVIFYEIKAEEFFEVESKYFRDNLVEYIFGVRNIKIHSVIRQKNKSGIRVLKGDGIYTYLGDSFGSQLKKESKVETLEQNSNMGHALVKAEEKAIIGNVALSDDEKMVAYIFRDDTNVKLAINFKKKKNIELSLSNGFRTLNPNSTTTFLKDEYVFVSCATGYIVVSVDGEMCYYQNNSEYNGLCLIN